MKNETSISNLRILLIEDNSGDARLIKEMLKDVHQLSIELEHADSLSFGTERLTKGGIDLVLLDLSLPDSQGVETLARLRKAFADIPVVVLTGLDNEESAIEAIGSGAQDYLVKSLINSHSLFRSIRYALERHRMIEELRKANRRLLDHQKKAIEEERLKVLLQIAGATAHELNQPLTSLLGNLDLLELCEPGSNEAARHIKRIKEAGRRIADIVVNIKAIQPQVTRPPADDYSMIDLNQNLILLSVEDSDADFEKIDQTLKPLTKAKLLRAPTIGDALRALTKYSIDVVFMDHGLPDGNSFDLLELIEREGIEVPVVVVTGQGDEVTASRVIQAGAYDYLPKTMVSKKSLLRSANNALEKFRLKREAKLAMEKMARMSSRDELTGLYNRRYFIEALEREMARSKRYGNALGLCLMDLDLFKRINDTYGHIAGDQVLSEIGSLLKECTREIDLPCRYGGEEFAVIFPDTDTEGIRATCERIRELVSNHPFSYNSARFSCTVSIGIAFFNADCISSSSELIDSADQALYKAKNAGRNNVLFDNVKNHQRIAVQQ